MIGKILTNSALTVMVTGRKAPFTISRDHKMFPEILKAVQAGDEKALLGLIDIASAVQKHTQGKVAVKNGQVYYNNEVIHNVVAERILSMVAEGIDFKFMAKFLENLMQNPSYSARQELYLFMENGNMPITDDGRFLAFKWVTDDYLDCHSRTVDNHPGQKPKMDRGAVDDKRENTCSTGYHVCTHAYTKFGERLMIVAVNPRDVVSVPVDYNNAKMRCCEYEVLYEVSPDEYQRMDGGIAEVSNSNHQGNDNHLTQKRDRNGRFCK